MYGQMGSLNCEHEGTLEVIIERGVKSAAFCINKIVRDLNLQLESKELIN